MKYRTLGRTGLKVSLVGLGTGGLSQFGQKSGVNPTQIRELVRYALDQGINFFDTAAGYDESECILGTALEGIPRDSFYLATKFQAGRSNEKASPQTVVETVERSLRRLRVETVDILQFHGLSSKLYLYARDELMSTVMQLQQQGKFRYLGVTESYSMDAGHEMLTRALRDDHFDTAMVGYNLLSPTAERRVLPQCRENDVGVICMVAVRRSLSRPDYLRSQIAAAKKHGIIAPDALPNEDPLGWLLKEGVPSLAAAGYKYVAAHPAISTILTGTSNREHLEENIDAILGPPLDQTDMERLRSIFGNVEEPLGN